MGALGLVLGASFSIGVLYKLWMNGDKGRLTLPSQSQVITNNETFPLAMELSVKSLIMALSFFEKTSYLRAHRVLEPNLKVG